MKFIAFTFASYMALNVGVFCGNFIADYYDHFIDKKVNEKIQEIQAKGKPAYCSFWK